MSTDQLTIQCSNDIDIVISQYSTSKGLRKVKHIKLIPPSFDTENNLPHLENKLNKRLNACGCEFGAIFMLGSLSFCLLWIHFFNPTGWSLSLKSFLILLSIVVFSTVIGKLFGLYLAKHQFLKTLQAVKDFYNQPLKPIYYETM